MLTGIPPADHLCAFAAGICARVCPAWWQLVRDHPAYVRGLIGLEERAEVLVAISEALQNLMDPFCGRTREGFLSKGSLRLGEHNRSLYLGDDGSCALWAALRAAPSEWPCHFYVQETDDPIPEGPLTTSIWSIDLGNSGLGDAGVSALASALPPTLSSLDISDVACGNTGMSVLAGALRSTSMQRFASNKNPAISEPGWRAFGACLPFLPDLIELSLHSCRRMGKAGLAAIAAGLPATKIEVLMLDGSTNDAGVVALAPVLPRCDRLSELYLRTNQLAKEGASALAAVLPRLGENRPLHVVLEENEQLDAADKAAMEAAAPTDVELMLDPGTDEENDPQAEDEEEEAG